MALWQDCAIACTKTHEGDGFIQRYVHLTRQFEAPTSFHVFSLLAALAASTSRTVVIDRGGYRLWPNLYVLLHGPSGLGKGIASDHAKGIVKAAAGDMLREYPEDLTGEGLFEIMADQTERRVSCVGLVYADEFGDLLGGQEYKAELSKRLTRLYSSPDRMGVGRSGSGERWICNVFLNILGCSQEDWLRTLPISAIKGGLFARIITVPEYARRFRKFYPAVDRELAANLIEELRTKLAEVTTGVVTLTPEAHDYSLHWYEDGEDERWREMDPIVLPWCERRLDHALKLAYLNTMLEGQSGPHRIDEEGIQWGIEVVEWLTPRIQEAFLRMNETAIGEMHRIIETMVVRKAKMSEADLRSSLGHRWGRGQMEAGIRHLIETHKIRRVGESNGQGLISWELLRVDKQPLPSPSTSHETSSATTTTPSGDADTVDEHSGDGQTNGSDASTD